MESLSHINKDGNPHMVNVGNKEATKRIATAMSIVKLNKEIFELLESDEFQSKKGPVLQTAILAGIMGAKQTGHLIPLCHPLMLDNCNIEMEILDDYKIKILCTASITGKTGVEMEALMGASIAGLTIYDMCKAVSHEIVIEQVQLLKKTGGKSDYLSKRQ